MNHLPTTSCFQLYHPSTYIHTTSTNVVKDTLRRTILSGYLLENNLTRISARESSYLGIYRVILFNLNVHQSKTRFNEKIISIFINSILNEI